jgi:hypothetical protein
MGKKGVRVDGEKEMRVKGQRGGIPEKTAA